MGVGLVEVAFFIPLLQGVFCRTWAVKLPKSIVGISGSCITIPCSYQVPENIDKNLQNCSGGVVWKKGRFDGLTVFNAKSIYTNKIQGRVVGNVTQKDCTTLFHSFPSNYSDVYFFRLECVEPIKFTFMDPVNIFAYPEPSPPAVTPVTQVSEGNLVKLQCSIPVPCSILPPSITWHFQNNSLFPESQQQQVIFMAGSVEKPMTMTSTLTFKALAEHHNQRVTCVASYPLTTGGIKQSRATTERMNILYGPRMTVITLTPSGPLSEGRTVTLTCSSDANPPVMTYTWYRVNSKGKLFKIAEGEILVQTVSQQNSRKYLCEARSKMSSQRSRPVYLEISTTADSNNPTVVGIYILCGILLLLFILIVVVDVKKYQRLSKRLKQIEQREEHTYANLRTVGAPSVYEELKQPKTAPSFDDHDYVQPI